MKRWRIIIILVTLLIILIAVAVYFLNPKYAFTLEGLGGTQEAYKVSIYNNRLMVISFGSKQMIPEIGDDDMKMELFRQRQKTMSLDFTKTIHFKILTEQQYNKLVYFYDEAQKLKPKYSHHHISQISELRGTAWDCVFDVNGEAVNFQFEGERLLDYTSEEKSRAEACEYLLQYVLEVARVSPCQIYIPGDDMDILNEEIGK